MRLLRDDVAMTQTPERERELSNGSSDGVGTDDCGLEPARTRDRVARAGNRRFTPGLIKLLRTSDAPAGGRSILAQSGGDHVQRNA